MVVDKKHFELKPRSWLDGATQDEARRLQELGLDKSSFDCDGMELDDRCFSCGKTLRLPYVYWQGIEKHISLHSECASHLARGISRDSDEIEKTI